MFTVSLRKFTRDETDYSAMFSVISETSETNTSLYARACQLRGVTPNQKIVEFVNDLDDFPSMDSDNDYWFVFPDKTIAEYGKTGGLKYFEGEDYSYLNKLGIDVDLRLCITTPMGNLVIATEGDNFYRYAFTIHQTDELQSLYWEAILKYQVNPSRAVSLYLDSTDSFVDKLFLFGIKKNNDDSSMIITRSHVEETFCSVLSATGAKVDWNFEASEQKRRSRRVFIQ